MFVRVIGKTKILLLHGYADSAFLFSSLIKKINSNYDVYALNLPMCEEKYKIYDLDSLALYVINFTKKIGISNYLLVGFSLGGMVATKVAFLDEKNVKGLILLNSSPSLVTNELLRKFIRKTYPLWKRKPFLYLLARVSVSKFFRSRYGRKNIREDELDRIKNYYVSIFGTLFNVIGSSLEEEFCSSSIPKNIKLFKDDEILKHQKYLNYLKNLSCEADLVKMGGHASKPIYWDNVAQILNKYESRY